MPNDQRILDIIASASEKKPADLQPVFNELVGERIAELIDQKRADTRATFFAEPEAANDDGDAGEDVSTEDQPAPEEAPNGEDV